ncbi:MAG TPA: type II toxin-antitoxin system HicB family antitoxin [Chloroflexota bacterium]|jgi:predicted RNase H-like HicB family nuclease
MHYTVILVRDDAGRYSVLVPSMPGCLSMGESRADALIHAQEAIAGWLQTEAERGRGPLSETSTLIVNAVSASLAIIDEMRAAEELPPDHGYDLELATVSVPQSIAA